MKKYFSILTFMLLLILATIDLKAVGEQTIGSTTGEDFKKVGATGAQFLKIPIGARGTAMGGAYTAATDDLSSIFWNPAGLANIHSIQLDFSYLQWFAGYTHNFGAISLPVSDRFTAALSVISFGSGDIEITTIEKHEGTGQYYRVNDIAIVASFAGYLTEQFSFGVNAKLVRNAFSSLSSSGIAFDVGTMYETGIQGIKLGFSIFNLGTQMEYSGQDLKDSKRLWEALFASKLDITYLSSPYSAPLIFRAGVSSDVYKDETSNLTAAFDFITLSDTPEQFALGAEYTWNDFVSVRGGYRIGDNQFGPSGGFGLKYIGGGFNGKIDYSINPTKELGLVNRLTVSLGFGG